jgi:hypothetical protein
VSRTKHSGKAIDPTHRHYRKRMAAAYGVLSDSPLMELALRLENYAKLRELRAQSTEAFAESCELDTLDPEQKQAAHESSSAFAIAGGLGALYRLREDCERRCVALCFSAIRFDKERGKLKYDGALLIKLGKAIETLEQICSSGAVQRDHRDVLDLLRDGQDTIQELLEKLKRRRPGVNHDKRRVRNVVKEVGMKLKPGKPGRPRK